MGIAFFVYEGLKRIQTRAKGILNTGHSVMLFDHKGSRHARSELKIFQLKI